MQMAIEMNSVVSNDVRRLPAKVETDKKPKPGQHENSPSSWRRQRHLMASFYPRGFYTKQYGYK